MGKRVPPSKPPVAKVVQSADLDRLFEEYTSKLEQKVATQTRQLRDELAASQKEKAEVEAILRSIGDGLVALDREGKITRVNHAFEALMGWKAAEVIGRDVYEVMPMEDEAGRRLELQERPYRRVLARGPGGVYSTSIYYVRRDKTRFPANLTTAPIIAGGEVVGVVIDFEDVTEQRRFEESLKRQSRVLDSMAEGVSVTDENGIIVFTNPAEDVMFGYRRGELIGRHVSEQNAYPAAENRRRAAEVMRQLKTTGSWSGEWHNRRKDGSLFYTSARITALEIAGKRYWVCVQADITRRKATEEALSASEQRFRTIIEQSPISIQIFSPDGKTVRVNKAWEKMWDVPSEVAQEVLANYNVLEDPQLETKGILPYIKRGFAGEPVAMPPVRYDPAEQGRQGRIRWIEATIYPITSPEGVIREVALVHLDVTDRLRAEESQKFILQASQVLSASLNQETILRRLAELAVPQLGDWCAVDMVDGRSLKRVAVQHKDPQRIDLAYQLLREFPPQRSDPYGSWQVVRTSRSQLLPEVTDEVLQAVNPDPAFTGIVRQLGLKSAMVVPIAVRGKVLGVVSFVLSETYRRYDQQDLRLAEDLATRAASAIENAQLYRQTEEAREALERRVRERTAELAKERERLAEAQKIATMGSWEWDIESNQLHWSDEMYRIYGLKGDFQPTYDRVKRLTHPKDADYAAEQIQRALQQRGSFAFDYRIVRPDKSVRAVNAQGRVAVDNKGKAIRLMGTVQDITERKQVEWERLRLTNYIRAIVDSSDDAITGKTTEGVIVSWNAGAQRLYGYTPKEVEGKSISILVPPDRQDELPVIMERIKRGESIDHVETERVRKDGVRIRVSLTISPIRDADGSVIGASTIGRDVTEQRRIEQLKTDFVSLVSHQLKTPVAIIRGYAENLLSGVAGELTDRQSDYLRDVRDISARNYDLISDLLNFSRLERGVISVQVKRVKLSDIIDASLRNYRSRIERKGLRLRLAGVDGDTEVLADKFKMVEALSNIIDNAVKFTDSGAITLTSRSDSGFCVVEVKDTGQGMDEQMMGKLFSKDQVFSGSPTAEGGSGLGLYIAKAFMNIQSGDLTARSRPGKGSVFKFKIPLAAAKTSAMIKK